MLPVVNEADMNEDELLLSLQKKIGYSFHNKDLLLQALTHSSYANERTIHKTKDYERIEFLGDAVLEVVSSEFLYFKYPSMPEGNLTKLRASLVCEQALSYCAKDMNLGEYIRFGKGESRTGGKNRDSIIADVMEAITGAIFLDSGMEQAKKFILTFILSDLENKQLFYDSKTILQERIQKCSGTIRYELVDERGPEHEKIFEVRVLINEKIMGQGQGKSKKSAEQQASYDAILKLNRETEEKSK